MCPVTLNRLVKTMVLDSRWVKTCCLSIDIDPHSIANLNPNLIRILNAKPNSSRKGGGSHQGIRKL